MNPLIGPKLDKHAVLVVARQWVSFEYIRDFIYDLIFSGQPYKSGMN